MKAQIWGLLLASYLPLCAPALGELVGGNFQVESSGLPRFPDVTFSTVDNKYLVVWSDYGQSPTTVMGRFVSNAGVPLGTNFQISSGIAYALLPAVCYNPTDNEFLVTWDDARGSDTIYGQRVSSTTGLLLGPNVSIGTVAGGVRSASAWNAATNTYLVSFSNYSEVFFQRLNNLGLPLGTNINITNDPNFSGLPAACSDNGTQFLVTWDHGIGDNGIIRGRRFSAIDGSAIGGYIDITTLLGEDRSMIAFDPANNRWCVEYQEHVTGGNSYDQYGRFVTTAGVVTGSPIPFATGPDFEGDTLWGCDIAFIPNLGGRYLVSFALAAGQGAQEAHATGNLIGGRINQGVGDYTSLSNAADPNINRWLTVWETPSPPHHIWGQLYQATDLAAPPAVTNFTATPASGQLILNWTNPNVPDFEGTMIRYKTTGYPAHVNDGTLLVDQPNTPGSNATYVHMGLPQITHYYSAFSYDNETQPNFSTAENVSGIPAAKGDFDVDTDVDQKDFGHFQNCLSGSLVPYGSGCSDADFDVDGDVDQVDFTTFNDCLNGANQLPGC